MTEQPQHALHCGWAELNGKELNRVLIILTAFFMLLSWAYEGDEEESNKKSKNSAPSMP